MSNIFQSLLFPEVQVGIEHGIVLQPSSNDSKNFGSAVTTAVSMTNALQDFDNFLYATAKPFLGDESGNFDYNACFATAYKEAYNKNTNTLGQLKVTYNRAEIVKLISPKIEKAIQKNRVTDIAFQKPINDRELYEWQQGLQTDPRLQRLSTKEDNFATGFCLIGSPANFSNVETIPFDDRTRYEWSSKLAEKAMSTSVNEMYVFVPTSVRGEEFVRDGIRFHFVPTTNSNFNILYQKVQDNMGFEKSQLGGLSSNSFHMMDIKLGQSMSSHFIFYQSVISAMQYNDGAQRIPLETLAESATGEILDYIIAKTYSINSDAAIAKSPFTFIFK